MDELQEGKELSRNDILERLRKVWELIDFGLEKISEEVSEKIEMNFRLAEIFVSLQGSTGDISQVDAIGFNADICGNLDEEEEE